jgi:hypothetical protein
MIFNFFSLAFHVALVIYCSHVLLNYGRALTAVGFYFTLATLLFQVFAASQGAAELAGAWQETQTTRLALLEAAAETLRPRAISRLIHRATTRLLSSRVRAA